MVFRLSDERVRPTAATNVKFCAGLLVACLVAACSDAPEPAAAVEKGKLAIGPDTPPGVVAEGAEWEVVAQNVVFADSPARDAAGNVYYSATVGKLIYKIDPLGNIEIFDQNTAMTMGLFYGPDGYLYGCRNLDAQIVRYDLADGSYDVLYTGELTLRSEDDDSPRAQLIPGDFCNDLAVRKTGLWYTDRENEFIMYVDFATGEARAVAGGHRANGIHLSLDESMLVVTDSLRPRLVAYRVLEDGGLEELPDYFDPIDIKGKKQMARLGEEVRPGYRWHDHR